MTLLLPTQHLWRKKGARRCPRTFRQIQEEVSPGYTCSQTTQLKGKPRVYKEADQVRGRLGLGSTARQREGRGPSRAIGQLRATLWGRLVLSSLVQCMDRRDGGGPRRPSCGWLQPPPWTLFRPVPSLKSRQSWVKGQLEGLGCSRGILQVHSREDTYLWASRGRKGQVKVLPILSGGPPGQQDPGISIPCPSREWSSI